MPTPSIPPSKSSKVHIPSAVIALMIISAVIASVSPLVPPDVAWWVKAIFVGASAGVAAGLAVFRPSTSALLLVAVLVGSAVTGCGSSWQGQARDTLGLASRATVYADRIVAVEAGTQCPEHDDACLHTHKLDLAYDSLSAAKSAIAAGEAALLHALDTGVENLWSTVARCLGASIYSLLGALGDAGVQIPPWVQDAATMVRAMLGACPTTATK